MKAASEQVVTEPAELVDEGVLIYEKSATSAITTGSYTFSLDSWLADSSALDGMKYNYNLDFECLAGGYDSEGIACCGGFTIKFYYSDSKTAYIQLELDVSEQEVLGSKQLSAQLVFTPIGSGIPRPKSIFAGSVYDNANEFLRINFGFHYTESGVEILVDGRASSTGISNANLIAMPHFSMEVTNYTKPGTWVNEGLLINEEYQLFGDSEIVELPPDPVKEGYDFVGWYYDEALTQPYDGAPITADTQLYAKFEKKQFTVTFDTAGGAMSGGASETYTVPWDEYFTVMAYRAEKAGHRFLGWQLPDGSMAGDSILVTDNITLTAKWQIESYTIRFETNGGEPMADKQLEYGTELTLEAPVKEGSTFTGWYSDEGLTNLFGGAGGTLTVDGDKTLYAGWEIKSYTVKFEALGGTAVASQVVYYGSAADEEPTATERTGYNFTGWYLNGTLYNFATPVMSDITLTAGWEIKMFTVTFYVDGEVYATSEVAYGTKLSSVMTETANLMNLQVTALSVPSDEDFKDVEVKQDLEVTAVPMTGADKVLNVMKNYVWWIVGGAAALVVVIGIIVGVVCAKKKPAKRGRR